MSNKYDGAITYFSVGYDAPFYDYDTDDAMYSLDASSVQTLADICNDDWFLFEPDRKFKIYFSGEEVEIADFSRVHMLGLKTEDYAVFLFCRGSEDGERKFYLNLINVNTLECVKFAPELKNHFTDYNIMGVASVTPLTKVFVIGYDEKFIAFYSSLFRRLSDDKEFQIVATQPYAALIDRFESYASKCHIISMDGSFFETCNSSKYIKPILSVEIPFKALVTYVIVGKADAYASVGDILTSVQDTDAKSSKVTYNNVDYCKYVSVDDVSSKLWFRVYGGANGV